MSFVVSPNFPTDFPNVITVDDTETGRYMDYFPERTCCIEHVKSGALYDVWRYTCCDYEHAESKTDAGASEIPTNFCPKCGARVVGVK